MLLNELEKLVNKAQNMPKKCANDFLVTGIKRLVRQERDKVNGTPS